MDIPQCCQLVAGKTVHHCPQTGGICINSAGFQEQSDAEFFCLGKKNFQIGPHGIFPVGQSASHHIRHLYIAGHFHQHQQVIQSGVRAGDVAGSVKTGDIQMQFPQLPYGGGRLIGVERAASVKEGIELGQVVDLYAGKSHFLGGMEHFVPTKVGPAPGRKGEIHTISSS